MKKFKIILLFKLDLRTPKITFDPTSKLHDQYNCFKRISLQRRKNSIFMQILSLKITVKKIYHLISSTVLFAYQFNLLQFSWQLEMHTQRLNKKIGFFFFLLNHKQASKLGWSYWQPLFFCLFCYWQPPVKCFCYWQPVVTFYVAIDSM